jgi:hypothetical protein
MSDHAFLAAAFGGKDERQILCIRLKDSRIRHHTVESAITLASTIARINVASVWSCKKRDTIAAPIKIKIIGLLNWATKSANAPVRR